MAGEIPSASSTGRLMLGERGWCQADILTENQRDVATVQKKNVDKDLLTGQGGEKKVSFCSGFVLANRVKVERDATHGKRDIYFVLLVGRKYGGGNETGGKKGLRSVTLCCALFKRGPGGWC